MSLTLRLVYGGSLFSVDFGLCQGDGKRSSTWYMDRVRVNSFTYWYCVHHRMLQRCQSMVSWLTASGSVVRPHTMVERSQRSRDTLLMVSGKQTQRGRGQGGCAPVEYSTSFFHAALPPDGSSTCQGCYGLACKPVAKGPLGAT